MQALRQAAKLAREIVQCKTNQVGRAALFSLPRLRVQLSQLLRAVAELFVNGNDVPPFTVDQARCLRFVDCLVSHRHYALVMARDAAALAQLGAVAELLQDPEAEVRQTAVAAVADLDLEAAYADELAELLGDRAAQVRNAASAVLKRERYC